MLRDVQRQLTDGERERLRKEVARADRERIKRLKYANWVLPMIGVILCVWTLAASDVGATIVIPIWAGITALLVFLGRRDIRREITRRIQWYEAAQRDGHVREVEIEASAVVVHPETGIWAYQVEGPRIVFVNFDEDEHPEATGVPSRQLVVQILTADGVSVFETSESGGAKLPPSTKFERVALRNLRWPEHLTVLDGRLEDLPSLLGQSR
jgi:uncharacterized membrane protein YfbV (UPF0208 family)